MILLLKLLVNGNEEGTTDFKNIYLDPTTIIGFLIPETEDYEGDCINLYISGGTFTVKQTPNILKYLTDNFVKKAIL